MFLSALPYMLQVPPISFFLIWSPEWHLVRRRECAVISTRWLKYDQDKLWLVYTQIVSVIFEPPCINFLAFSSLLPLLSFTRLPQHSLPNTFSPYSSLDQRDQVSHTCNKNNINNTTPVHTLHTTHCYSLNGPFCQSCLKKWSPDIRITGNVCP